MTHICNYTGNGNIEVILNDSPYQFRATTEYALSVLGINNKLKTPYYWIYIAEDDIKEWKQYLRQNGLKEILPDRGIYRTFPNLTLEVVKSLPRPAKQNPRVLNTKQLLEEIVKGMPRLVENHPEIIKKLKRIA